MTTDITTVEQIDAFPEGTILRDHEGDRWEKQEGMWLYMRFPKPEYLAKVVLAFAPLVILHLPEDDRG